MYTCSSGTLASFSTGRPTSLVIDIGACQTRIIPVVDGYALNKGKVETFRAGNYMDGLLLKELEDFTHTPITSWHDRQPFINSSSSINSIRNSKPNLVIRDLFIQDIIRDIKRTMCFIPYKPISITHHDSQSEYMNSSYSLCTVPEHALFPRFNYTRKRSRQEIISELSIFPYLSPESILLPLEQKAVCSTSYANNRYTSPLNIYEDPNVTVLPLHQLVLQSICHCDVETRRELLANIILVGGGSLIDGLMQRLSYELTELLPTQFKVSLLIIAFIITTMLIMFLIRYCHRISIKYFVTIRTNHIKYILELTTDILLV
jgi:actin-related protein